MQLDASVQRLAAWSFSTKCLVIGLSLSFHVLDVGGQSQSMCFAACDVDNSNKILLLKPVVHRCSANT